MTVGDIGSITANVSPTNTTQSKDISFSSSDSKIIGITSASGSACKISANGAGTATITAKSSNGKTAICKITVNEKVVTIDATSITLNMSNITLEEGKSQNITATIKPTNTTDKTITWSSNNTNVATVSNGKITAIKEGSAIITAKTSNGKTAKINVTVIKIIPITSVKLNKSTARVFTDGTVVLSSTIAPTNTTIDKTITWSSSNTKIATVDGNGKVEGKKAGIVNITAKTSNGKTATCKVTVIDKIPITSIKLNKTSESIFVNNSISLTVTINPTNANIDKTITWSSSNTKIATVDSSGKVKGIKAGTATITAKSSNGKTATCKITVQNEITKPNVLYSTHVENIGWQNYVKNGAMSGTSGRSLRLEGIKIKLENNSLSGNIEYRTHVQDIGWQNYVKNNNLSGTTGRSLRLEAISIRLTDELSQYFDVYYRVHCQDIGWMNWAKNGENAGSAGYSYRLEGIEIIIVEKDKNPPARTNIQYNKPFKCHTISYTTHVQDIGWQNRVFDGAMAGTSGKSLRLEAIKINLENKAFSGDIDYCTHVENIGWQNYVKNGAMSGTSGKGLRLEAIKIRLTGEMNKNYDIYYRVHCQNIGWMNWAKNGEESGSSGYSYRLEGIDIVLVEKGTNPPSRNNFNTTKAFIRK